jgi:hypothetical protein
MPPACTIYPEALPLSVRQDPKLSAEVRFYDALRRQMPAGWLVFYDVAWLGRTRPSGGQRDGQIDFIVAHPNHGILLIEVKGGDISYDGRLRRWISRDRHGVEHEIDPFGQAVTNKYALLHKLRELRPLRDTWIELAHAVAFPDTARPQFAVTPDAPPEIIIGSQDTSRLAERIREILEFIRDSAGRVSKGGLIVGELERLLARSITLPNPLAIQFADEYREIVDLTESQIRTLSILQRVRRASLGGCAGCGKTFLAMAKARDLAGQGFRTLLTCYSRPLNEFLRGLTRDVENLDVFTIHGLAEHLVPGLTLADSPAQADIEYPGLLFDALQASDERPYDAVIVDEGQDISAEWWLALESCLSEGKDSVFYVFHDTHQTLFSNANGLPADLLEVPLEENLRNTQAICQELARHYQGRVAIRPRGPSGRKVVYQVYGSEAELARMLGDAIHQLLTVEVLTNRDLVVLTPRDSLAASSLSRIVLPHGIRLVPDEPRSPGKEVLCRSVAEFKGLERKVVIVAEVDGHLPVAAEARDALLYVAFSRPRHHLIVYHTSDAAELFRNTADKGGAGGQP